MPLLSSHGASPGFCCLVNGALAPIQLLRPSSPNLTEYPAGYLQGCWVTPDKVEECRAPDLAPHRIMSTLNDPQPPAETVKAPGSAGEVPSGGTDTDGGRALPSAHSTNIPSSPSCSPSPSLPTGVRGHLPGYFSPRGRPLASALDVTKLASYKFQGP